MPTPLQQQTFPLDFNAEDWSADEVVKWVFLGELAATNPAEWEESVSYVRRRLERRSGRMPGGLLPQTKGAVGALANFLRGFPGMTPSTDKPPVVWARLALQYWLSHGDYNKAFVAEFSDWLTEQGHTSVRIAPKPVTPLHFGGQSSSSVPAPIKGKQVVMPAFLLAPFSTGHFVRQSVSVIPAGTHTAKPSVPEAVWRDEKLRKMLGSHLYNCVKRVIEDAVTNPRIPNLSASRDPETDKFKFTGRHDDLCSQILRYYKNETGRYKESTVRRAIRHFVRSRLSWV